LSIDFHFEDLAQHEQQAYLYLYFGGKYSPYKGSIYLFDFAKPENLTNHQKLMEGIHVNRLFKDLHEELGWKKEDIVSGQFHTLRRV
jgi:hypothetical protein